MDGVLNLNKPTGMTSHDVVDYLRHAAGQKEVGHAGTLDPSATGVLLCLLGRATRLTPYLQELPKKYRGVIQFGIRTNTQDAEGEVFYQKPAPHLTLDQVRAAAEKFKGRILQIPPMFSAVRLEGKKLHELARKGQEVLREPRPVQIYRLEIFSFQPGDYPMAEFELECSKGTYVRTLASDIGDALSVGAHLKQLTRTAVGSFQIEDACTLAEVADAEGIQQHLIPIADALAHLPRWSPVPAVLERLKHGNFVQAEHPLWTPGGHIVVLDTEGKVALIARWLPPLLRPVRVIQG
ncbi:MAG: tRNA pseudouridine(55) synthase TruB [Fimbriimonadales bacterium]|nr:tRNA pseudouridine(55) synthase TruB [Fimbriimonadales bacterium]